MKISSVQMGQTVRMTTGEHAGKVGRHGGAVDLTYANSPCRFRPEGSEHVVHVDRHDECELVDAEVAK